VSIVVQCPHCETKFNLQPDMVGKSMRCPNLDCRQVFTVKAQPREIEPPKPEPTPIPAPAPAPMPLPLPPEPTAAAAKPKRPAKPAAPAVVEAEIVEAAVVAPPKVKEVVWTEGTDVPPTKGKKPVRPEVLDEPDDEPIRRRKKKRDRRPLILIGMVVVGVVAAGAGLLYYLRFQDITEKTLAKQADEEFQKGDHAAAAKSFEKLAAEYPDSDDAPKYKFFAALAGMKVVVFSVTNREEPDPAVQKYRAFLDAHKDSPFAKHTSGYGGQILDAGRKLGEDLAAHADDRVKAFRADRTKSGELDRAEKAIATGRALLPLLEPFRAADDPPLDNARKEFDRVEGEVKRERDRTAAITRLIARLEKNTDAEIQAGENELAAAGFANDPEAQALIAAAKGKLRALVRYEPDPAAPRNPPATAAATILFVAPIGQTRRAPAAVDDAPPAVFLALARGILYALDEDTGTLLWAVRVGPDITDPPTVARVDLDQGPTDLAVVASNVDGEPAVAAYVVKTGAARWYQPLPAPAAGPAVVVGTRAYVPVRDPEGTIYEFDLTSGTRRGRIRLGQPVGLNAAVVRPGTGLLYVAADARRVYVIDAGAKDDDGNPLPPRCVQVIATGHLPGTLRTPPLLLGPEGDTPAERWMILAQADEAKAMKLRAFALGPVQPLAADGTPPPETPATAEAELPVGGWARFPLVSDGERIAVATDFGQFRLFGVKAAGGLDKPLFPLPEPRSAPPPPPEGTAIPGLVFPAEEAAFWVLANGNLQKFRVATSPSRVSEVMPVGPAIPLGVPTQPPQLNNRKDSVCLVVRSQNSAGCKAVLVSLRDAEQRWQRQLGVVPAAGAIPQGDGVLLVAEDGGLVVVPSASGTIPGRNTVAPPEWVIAAPPENATGPTAVAVSADGKTVFAVTPVLAREDQKFVAKFVVRRVTGGQLAHEGTVNSPGALVGPPVILGDSLLLPASDGFVHRHVAGTGRTNPDTLAAGPPWGADRRTGEPVCHITPVSDTSFLTGNGTKTLKRWDWPKNGRWTPAGGTWELRERPAGPGVALPPAGAGPPRLLIADETGSVWLYDAQRGGQPLKRWKPGGGMPVGRPSSALVVQNGPEGRTVVVYTVENKYLVCLDPGSDHPPWAVRTSDDADVTLIGAPQSAGDGRWMATDLAGRVTLLDGESGKVVATLGIGLPGAVPAAAGGPLGGRAALTPLSDGSAVILPLPAPPPAAPEPKGGEK
jgi:hypothetical protein